MTFTRIDHTAIAVKDMTEALERYERLYGIQAGERSLVQDQGVEVAFLPLGDTMLELVCPISATSGVVRFLERHGEGLHHIGILVTDIRAELRRLEQQGVALIDREPRVGVHGCIAFVHPRGTGGILLELIEKHTEETPVEHLLS